jgi:hypothetical protein
MRAEMSTAMQQGDIQRADALRIQTHTLNALIQQQQQEWNNAAAAAAATTATTNDGIMQSQRHEQAGWYLHVFVGLYFILQNHQQQE